jgi:hypothetical protein
MLFIIVEGLHHILHLGFVKNKLIRLLTVNCFECGMRRIIPLSFKMP